MAQEQDEKRPQDRLFNQTKGEPEVAGHIRAHFGDGRSGFGARRFRPRFEEIAQACARSMAAIAAWTPLALILLQMSRLSPVPGIPVRTLLIRNVGT